MKCCIKNDILNDDVLDVKDRIPVVIKDCCNQETCCEECCYEDCMEGCEIFDEIYNCQNCDYYDPIQKAK